MAVNNTKLKNQLEGKANNQITNIDSSQKGMTKLLNQMSDQIKKALPSMVSSERFQRVVLTAFNANPKLQQCDPTSFLASMMQSAQLGLEPNTPLGQAYLIPYGKNVQFQIGYKGLLELAQRSGRIKTVYAHEVRVNDEFDIDYGLEQKLIHKPNLKGDRGEVIGYYAVYHLDNNGYSFIFMTKDEVEKHAKSKSKTFYNGPWQTDFDSMAKKTVLKQLLKYAPISIETNNAIVADNSIKSEIKEDMMQVRDESINVSFMEVDEIQEIEGKDIVMEKSDDIEFSSNEREENTQEKRKL